MKSLKIAFATAFVGMIMAFTPTRSYESSTFGALQSASATTALLAAISPQYSIISPSEAPQSPCTETVNPPFQAGEELVYKVY
jgi:hypothetical protein